MPYTDYDDVLLPQTPLSRTSEYKDAASVLEALSLTVASVTQALSAFEQEDLGAQDTAAVQRALDRSAWWLLAKLRSTRAILEDHLPEDAAAISDIVTGRAVYELALATGQSGRARERRTSIEEMAIALFGADFRSAESNGPGAPVGVVAVPVRKRYPE